MPLFTIQTNLAIDDEAAQSLLRLSSQTVASLLNKSENYVLVRLDTRANMLFAGTTDPAAFLQLKSLGLPEEQTPEFSTALCRLMEEQLNIPAERIYIEFSSPPRHLWGWNNKTF